ncbi:hypothetical protein [Neochlamydia sp. S13]|nr:hypothetical protein [Neochlamydia sp. S13]BBI17734.1 Protein AC3.5, isoform b [Neochlamydia sp. S13]
MASISLNSPYRSHEYCIDVNFLIKKAFKNIHESLGKEENLIELFHQNQE